MPRAPCVVSLHLLRDWLQLGPPKSMKIATISVVRSGAGLTPSPGRQQALPAAPERDRRSRFPLDLGMPIVDDIAGLRRILTEQRTIAVVGLSAQWHRPSYFAAKYMQDHGYRIIPVNPNYAEVLGEKCYPNVTAIPTAIDIVDCFRKPHEILPIAHEAVARHAKVLWMQLGI